MRKYSEYKKEVICTLLIALITFVFSLQCSPNLWYNVEAGASCEISAADFPWRAEETLQALVS